MSTASRGWGLEVGVDCIMHYFYSSRHFFFLLQTIVDAALSGFGPLYGRMMPYLHEVELEEHYFIQGPRVARSEAVVHFAKLGKDS